MILLKNCNEICLSNNSWHTLWSGFSWIVLMEKKVNVISYGIKNGKATRQTPKEVSKVKQQRNNRHPNGKQPYTVNWRKYGIKYSVQESGNLLWIFTLSTRWIFLRFYDNKSVSSVTYYKINQMKSVSWWHRNNKRISVLK